jgi:hypothetical protein
MASELASPRRAVDCRVRDAETNSDAWVSNDNHRELALANSRSLSVGYSLGNRSTSIAGCGWSTDCLVNFVPGGTGSSKKPPLRK